MYIRTHPPEARDPGSILNTWYLLIELCWWGGVADWMPRLALSVPCGGGGGTDAI